jgi:hypothetical protein
MEKFHISEKPVKAAPVTSANLPETTSEHVSLDATAKHDWSKCRFTWIVERHTNIKTVIALFNVSESNETRRMFPQFTSCFGNNLALTARTSF